MAFVEWNSSFSVSNEAMDADHQSLFALVNRLHQEFLEQRGRVETAATIEQLFLHTRHHFAAEEALMQAAGYPEYPAHRQAHETIVSKLTTLANASFGLTSEVGPQLLAYLMKDWLYDHILVMDKAYAACLLEHRSLPSPPDADAGPVAAPSE
jgi:hemerythrin